MSHFTRIQTQITDKPFLLQALKDLGFSYDDGQQQVKGYAGKLTPVDIRIPLQNSYDIGFQKVGSSYEAVADWNGVRGVNPKEFVQQLTQRYAYHVAKSKLEAQGFTLVEEQVNETGQIRLLLRRLES
jgi:hypothetical protein